MFLIASLLAFVVFVINVAMGAFAGSAFLGDVGEMLVLLAASALFVVAILVKEAGEKNQDGG